MNILILNQDWFAVELREMGHHVVTAGLADHLDIKIDGPLLHIDSVIKNAMPQHSPDVIIVLDNSAPIVFLGLDETEVPTIFYSVDTHHHVELHKYLANLFDYTLIAQKDYLPDFEAIGHHPEWMPLWASRHIEPSNDKRYQAVFVGTLNAKLNPDRVRFFDALKEKAPVHVQTGNFWELFPHAEVVVNQTVKGDLNFRVFEAMMSGAVLLTEASPNGLLELFREGEHLVTYPKNDVDQAAEIIRGLLADPARCRAIGASGRAEILARHTVHQRAQRIDQIVRTVKKKRSPQKLYSTMLNFASLALKMEGIDTRLAGRTFLAALKAADYAVKEDEPLNEELACFVVLSCINYERVINSGAAEALLEEIGQRHPNLEAIGLARIRILLNSGRRNEAEVLARALSADDVYDTFCRSDLFVESLLSLPFK